jgi:spore coat polysaccharide biosynthesis protein SpsF
LQQIGGKTLLGHIVYRLGFLKSEADIVIATSTAPADDAVADFCTQNNVKCFRGSENNVLSRYYECARLYGYENVARLTADNPFVDIEELAALITSHIRTNADYSQSFSVLPVGVGTEVFTFAALERSFREGHKPNHIEHVNEYIWENPDKFKINVFTDVPEAKRRPDLSLTVDTAEDYEKACYIVENSADEYITTEEALKLCLQYA